MAQFTTIYDHTNPAHRELKVWRTEGIRTWQTNARSYAAVHGESKVWRADDSVVRYWREGEKIRQRTYHKVIHAHMA